MQRKKTLMAMFQEAMHNHGLNKYSPAIKQLEKILNLIKANQDALSKELAANCRYHLGVNLNCLEQPAAAIPHLVEAVKHPFRDPICTCLANIELGMSLSLTKEHLQAITPLEAAHKLINLGLIIDKAHLFNLYYHLARSHFFNRKYNLALTYLECAEKYLDTNVDNHQSAAFNLLLGNCLIQHGQVSGAKKALEKALVIFTKFNNLNDAAAAKQALAVCALKAGSYHQMQHLVHTAAKDFERLMNEKESKATQAIALLAEKKEGEIAAAVGDLSPTSQATAKRIFAFLTTQPSMIKETFTTGNEQKKSIASNTQSSNLTIIGAGATPSTPAGAPAPAAGTAANAKKPT